MQLEIHSETSLSFDITVDGKTAILMMRDAEWRLCRDGDFGAYVGRGSTRWMTALTKALEMMTTPEQRS